MKRLLLILILLIVSRALVAQAQQTHSEDRPRLVAQLGHGQPVTSVAISPDGKWVVTGSFDKTARLWSVETGAEIRSFEGHSKDVRSVAISPDGRHVLTGSDQTARLWSIETGAEIRRFEGHVGSVESVAFSPDGRHVLTGAADLTARLWNVETGLEVQRYEGHSNYVKSATFSPDGQYVLTGSGDQTARLWSVEKGKTIQQFEGHAGIVEAVAISSDGQYVLTGSRDKTARLWSAETGAEIRSFEGHSNEVKAVAFSPDGQYVLTGGQDQTARLWSAETGAEIRRFEGHISEVWAVAFSPDGHYVLTGSSDHTAKLWSAETGAEMQRYEGHSSPVWSVAISSDGQYVLSGRDQGARLWSVEAGAEVRRFGGDYSNIRSVAISPDGQHVLTGAEDQTARLWSVETGMEIQRFKGHTLSVSSVAISPDSQHVLTGSFDKTARLWSIETGAEIQRFEGHSSYVRSVVFSPDGASVLTGSQDQTARLWSVETGAEIQRFEGHGDEVWSVAFSPDGASVLTGSQDQTARLWSVETGAEIRSFEGHESYVLAVAFSPDGRHVLTGSRDRTARLWSVETGAEIQRFVGHDCPVMSVAFSPDGRHVLTGSPDQTVRLWDTETGRHYARLISFRNGAWAVVDPQGRFDTSGSDDIEGLHWVVGLEPIALSQLKERYYEPGLLAKIFGYNDEPLRNVEAFTEHPVELFPEVTITHDPDEADRTLRLHLENRGGGIGRVAVFINNKEFTGDARLNESDAQAQELDLEVDLSESPLFIPGRDNTIDVVAYNVEGYLASRGARRVIRPKTVEDLEPPHLWAIVAGVSDYQGTALDLRYASKDAEDFSTALQVAAERLLGPERVHITPIHDGTSPATRANIQAAFEQMKKAKPTDILLVYLAGHGVTYGGQEGDYYYLLQEAMTGDLKDAAVRKQTALSSAELTEMIKQVPALKQVLILDTCHSGQLIEDLTEDRGVSSSQMRSLERLKDRTGMFVIAGSAADAVSYEATRYGQGVLTYSLLMGMRGAALREGEFVDVNQLFSYAVDKVPVMAAGIGGIQQPRLAVPRGGESFDIGQVTAADQKAIPLAQERPMVLRASFQDEEQFEDHLLLTDQMNEALRSASARGEKAPLVFVDAQQFPDAYRLVGRYTTEGSVVEIAVRLFQGKGKDVGQFNVRGSTDSLDALTADILRKAEEAVAQVSGIAPGNQAKEMTGTKGSGQAAEKARASMETARGNVPAASQQRPIYQEAAALEARGEQFYGAGLYTKAAGLFDEARAMYQKAATGEETVEAVAPELEATVLSFAETLKQVVEGKEVAGMGAMMYRGRDWKAFFAEIEDLAAEVRPGTVQPSGARATVMVELELTYRDAEGQDQKETLRHLWMLQKLGDDWLPTRVEPQS